MPEREWFFAKDGQRYGPVTGRQLSELAASGELRPTDLVWTEGSTDWVPAQSISGLSPSQQEPAPPMATPIADASENKDASFSEKIAGLDTQTKVLVAVIGGGGLLVLLFCAGCGFFGILGNMLAPKSQHARGPRPDEERSASTPPMSASTPPMSASTPPMSASTPPTTGPAKESEAIKAMARLAVAVVTTNVAWPTTTPSRFNQLMQQAATELGFENEPSLRHLLTITPSAERPIPNVPRQSKFVMYGDDVTCVFFVNNSGGWGLFSVSIGDREYSPLGASDVE